MNTDILKLLKDLKEIDASLFLENGTLKLDIKPGALTPEISNAIKSNKSDLIDLLSEKNNVNYSEIAKTTEKSFYPLSSAQYRLWVLNQLEKNSAAYNLPNTFRLEENYDIASFKRAIWSVLERHEILRTVFREDPINGVHQLVLNVSELNFDIGFQNFCDEKDPEQCVLDYIENDSYRPFDLENGPLIRVSLLQVSEDAFALYTNVHHIISDGWSMNILARDILSFYKHFADGGPLELPDLNIQYKDYASWQLEQLETEAYEKHKEYWLNKFSGNIPALDLPAYKQRPVLKTNNGHQIGFFLNKEDTSGILNYTAKNEGTLFMFLLSALNILFHRYTNQEDIIIGSPIAGREQTELENQIGLYLNTLALRNTVNPKSSFDAFFNTVKQDLLNAYMHQSYPFDQLIEELNISRDTSRSALIDVMVVLQNMADFNEEEYKVRSEDIGVIQDLGATVSKFDISFNFKEVGNNLGVELTYNTDVYDYEVVSGMLNHFQELIRAILKDSSTEVGRLEYLPEAEKNKLLFEFNDTKITYPENKTILDLYDEVVATKPDNTAVIYNGTSLTYQELDEYSNRLSHYLKEKFEVEKNDLIGIQLDRSEWMLISILGVLKSGGAYVPMGMQYPKERIAFIQKDSKYKVCIDQGFLDSFKAEKENYSKNKLEVSICGTDLAYGIYTSGSTGQPKGVLNGHSGLYNRLLWMRDDLQISENDIIFQKTTYTFDVSVWELLMPAIVGCPLVFAKPEGHKDPEYLQKVIKEQQVSIMHFVPSMLTVFLWNLEPENCKSLRHVVCSGEALSDDIVEDFKNKLPWINIHNLYGPTEAAIDVTTINLSNVDIKEKGVTIGKPVANTKIHIVDQYMSLQPIGVPGELLIEGIQVAKEYLNRPELNEKKFIASPFTVNERIYRSGDLARWLPNGEIDYIGRIDNQVKIRGNRVELGEIEHALKEHQAIKQVVVAVKKKDQENCLVAYIVAEKQIDKQMLYNKLSDQLPDYMVPSYFVVLDTIPLTQSGKVDRKSLPNISEKDIIKNIYTPPCNEVQAKLVDIWQKVLQVEKIGVNDDFYSLGGNSLKLILLLNEYRKVFDAKLTIQDLVAYSKPTQHEEIINAANQSTRIDIQKTKEAENYPLSENQQSLLWISQFEERSVAYNIPKTIELNGTYEIDIFRKAIYAVIERHESLRTVFRQNEFGEDRQWILRVDQVDFRIDYFDYSFDTDKEERCFQYVDKDSYLPFDLEKGPLLRGALFKLEEDRFLFYYNMHHIITDEISSDILNRDVLSFYNSFLENSMPDLPDLNLQYKDFAVWQNERKDSSSFKEDRNYWMKKLLGRLPVVDLPFQKSRPKLKTYNGRKFGTYISAELIASLKEFCKLNNGSLFVGALSAWYVLLHKYTQLDDLIVGTPVSGRINSDLNDQIGCYTNNIALRQKLDADQTFESLFAEVKAAMMQNLKYQTYPLHRIIEDLQIKNDISRNPVFDIMFSFHETLSDDPLGELDGRIEDYGTSKSKLDLLINFQENKGYMYFDIDFNSDVYDDRDVRMIMKDYQLLLESILKNTDERIKNIDFKTKKIKALKNKNLNKLRLLKKV